MSLLLPPQHRNPDTAFRATTRAQDEQAKALTMNVADRNGRWHREPLVIAHRGDSARLPENTMIALEAAARSGVDVIELDIQADAAGEAVVIHDDTVDRTTDGSGLVADLAPIEIARLDAGAWVSPSFRGQRIPTFAEIITLATRYPKVQWLVEFKGVWKAVHVARVGQQILGGQVEDRVILQSFEIDTVEVIAREIPEVRRALLATHLTEAVLRDARRLEVVAVNPHVESVRRDPGILHRIQDAGFQSFVWTANDVADWRLLIEISAHGIITDSPDRLSGYLAALRDSAHSQ